MNDARLFISTTACLLATWVAAPVARSQPTEPTETKEPAPVEANVDAAASDRDLAKRLYESAEYERAAATAERVTAASPDDAQSWAILGMSQLARAKYGASATALKRVAELSPRDAYYQLALGRAYAGELAFPLARVAYARAIGIHVQDAGGSYAQNATYHRWLGDAYRIVGAPSDARREFNRALELDPGDAQARTGIDLLDRLKTAAPAQTDAELASSAGEPSTSRYAPHAALFVNPVALGLGLATKVYTAGLELQFAGPGAAFDVYPQIGFIGHGNSFGVPDGATGQGLLIGTRVALDGTYLEGAFLLPRLGPVHWGSDSWSFWAMDIEAEVGYTWTPTFDGSITPLFQIGIGARYIVPGNDRIYVSAETAEGYAYTEPVSLHPVLGLLADLSIGLGWP